MIIPEGSVDILQYGFLGLAFLMAVLGFWLLRDAIKREGPASRPVLVLIGFFLVVTIAMMITAGVFEHTRKEIEIFVVLTDPIPEKVEPPRFGVGGNRVELDESGAATLRVVDHQQVMIVIDSLTSTINALRAQLQNSTRLTQASGDVGIVDEEN